MNDTVHIWLELAKSDLKSSKILYSHRQYRISLYLLQQASEKANKAYSLFFDQCSEVELKKNGHNQLQLFKTTLLKQEKDTQVAIEKIKGLGKPGSDRILKNIHNYKKLLSQNIELVDHFMGKRWTDVSAKELDQIVSLFNSLLKVKIKPEDVSLDDVIESINKYNSDCEIIDDILCVDIKPYLNGINDADKAAELLHDVSRIINFVIALSVVYGILFVFAALTHNLNTITRYPSDGKNPDSEYNLRLPVIRKQDKLIRILNKTIILFSQMNRDGA